MLQKCLINGQWVDSTSGATISVTNPFDGSLVGQVPELSVAQVEDAVQAAATAFPDWRKLKANQRSKLLQRWKELLLARAEEIGELIVLEQGKPLAEAIGEVRYAASYLEFYAEEAKRIYGELLPSPFAHTRVAILRQPVGVVAVITPWNFPIAMMMRKIAPALACGCTCVAKPDERTPLSALATLAIGLEAGIPPGVINGVTGVPAQVGEVLTTHPLVRKVTFTGSTAVGQLLMRQAASTVKRISLELGGNAPFIVFADADLEAAAKGLISNKFRNSGQTCICANRIFVEASVKTAFLDILLPMVQALKVGSGLANNEVGPLIDDGALAKVERLVQTTLTQGGKVVCGGTRHALGGTFYAPTVMTEVQREMDIFREEIFGPVIAISTFQTVAEVIELANDTQYGLASYFYANDMSKVWQVAEALEYGMVGVNRTAISSAQIPFGGVKASGFGREGSKYGLDDYLNIKYVCLGETRDKTLDTRH